MATRIQLRRGNTSDHSTFTGAEGEVTVDTDKNTIVVHDGSEAGGYPLVNMDGSDIKMQVDGDGAKSSRIVFDSIQHPHSEDGDGFTNPAFIIQGNYDDSASYGGVVGTEYLSANISQLGNGDLNISAGKLRLRGKRYYDNDPTGDDKYAHISYMGLSLDGNETQGTVLRLHWGLTNNTSQNIRLQPSENGIIVEGMGSADSPDNTKSNTGTIGTFNDEDLLTLAQNQLTVAGTVTADGVALGNDETIALGDGGELTITYESSTGRSTISETGSGPLIIKGTNGELQGATGIRNLLWDDNNLSLRWNGDIKLLTVQAGIRVVGEDSNAGAIEFLEGDGGANNRVTFKPETDTFTAQVISIPTAGDATLATTNGMAIYTSAGNISASTLVTERGKRIIINGDHDITLPDATADEVGYTWVIHNTHSGAITLDKGTADQTVKHLTGSAVTTITVATGTSVNIASGGVAELVCTAADNYIIFGSGIS